MTNDTELQNHINCTPVTYKSRRAADTAKGARRELTTETSCKYGVVMTSVAMSGSDTL